MLSVSLKSLLGIGLVLFAIVNTTELKAQTRYLPKSGFQTYSRSTESDLPGVHGLHLTPGEDRAANQKETFYPPGEPTLNGALVRWEARKMPLKIWIAPGFKLPDCPFEEIQETRVEQVYGMLKSPAADPFAQLQTAFQWTPDINYIVANGIEQWRRFQNEGLISFVFTEDPRNAQILVFFTDGFSESGTPGGTHVAGITSAQVYPYDLAQQVNIAQKPVVIELLVDGNNERLQSQSAHEFGHALGIKAHSPYRDDLMYVDRIVPQLSPADISTLRYLYKQKPQYVL
jgi:hypothetical protein